MSSLKLRGIKKAKTDCVRKWFNELKLSEGVRYEVVDNYQNLLTKIQAID